jgi:ABC-type iron transport system FetAB permease component
VESYIALNYWELAAASVLVFINAILSVIFGLRLHRSLVIAAIRMVVQLALVGGTDDAVLRRLAAMDWPRGARNGAVCGA